MVRKDIIERNLGNTLASTSFEGIGEKLTGKVRDIYVDGDRIYLISTDRQSAFDRNLAHVPFKGQVLTQTSAWWFEQMRSIVPIHVIDVPDPNVIVGRKMEIFPIEFVVRGYLTGSTSTSVWTAYEKGERQFCGNVLPENMRKNQKFAHPILTPTTKDRFHDTAISPDEILSQGLMSQKDWDYCAQKAFEVFQRGQQIASEHGLILVDTKYEFGRDDSGTIYLCDEIHTPDSSRYWLQDGYQHAFTAGKNPENIDKEFLRLWFREHCDPYNDDVLPEAPDELIVELAARYIQLYEMITGETFQYTEGVITDRISTNLRAG